MKSPAPHRKSQPRRRKRTRREIVELVIRVDRLLGRGLTNTEACEVVGIDQPTLRGLELALGLYGSGRTQVKLTQEETQS